MLGEGWYWLIKVLVGLWVLWVVGSCFNLFGLKRCFWCFDLIGVGFVKGLFKEIGDLVLVLC